ncbi:MAG: hypothetical protein AAGJ50_04945, partial [Pseudomonadota bacterium]
MGFASASGRVFIAIQNGAFTIEFDVTLKLGGLEVRAFGGASIFADSSPGLALVLGIDVDADIFSIIEIEADGLLLINTTGLQRSLAGQTLAANSFVLDISGSISILKVLNFEAGARIEVVNNYWKFSFNAALDFFGLVTLQANGFFDSRGHFDISLSGEMVLGTRSFGLVGNFSFRIFLFQIEDADQLQDVKNTLILQGQAARAAEIVEGDYAFGLTASAGLSLRAFGITFAGVNFSFSVTAAGSGRVPLVVSAQASVKILFIRISVSMSFTIGYIELPKPIRLAGDLNDASTFSGGDLYLNMGARADVRGLAEDEENEAFIVEHVGGTKGAETIKVTFSGRSQEFTGVNRIIADTGDGLDQLTVREGVLADIEYR